MEAGIRLRVRVVLKLKDLMGMTSPVTCLTPTMGVKHALGHGRRHRDAGIQVCHRFTHPGCRSKSDGLDVNLTSQRMSDLQTTGGAFSVA